MTYAKSATSYTDVNCDDFFMITLSIKFLSLIITTLLYLSFYHVISTNKISAQTNESWSCVKYFYSTLQQCEDGDYIREEKFTASQNQSRSCASNNLNGIVCAKNQTSPTPANSVQSCVSTPNSTCKKDPCSSYSNCASTSTCACSTSLFPYACYGNCTNITNTPTPTSSQTENSTNTTPTPTTNPFPCSGVYNGVEYGCRNSCPSEFIQSETRSKSCITGLVCCGNPLAATPIPTSSPTPIALPQLTWKQIAACDPQPTDILNNMCPYSCTQESDCGLRGGSLVTGYSCSSIETKENVFVSGACCMQNVEPSNQATLSFIEFLQGSLENELEPLFIPKVRGFAGLIFSVTSFLDSFNLAYISERDNRLADLSQQITVYDAVKQQIENGIPLEKLLRGYADLVTVSNQQAYLNQKGTNFINEKYDKIIAAYDAKCEQLKDKSAKERGDLCLFYPYTGKDVYYYETGGSNPAMQDILSLKKNEIRLIKELGNPEPLVLALAKYDTATRQNNDGLNEGLEVYYQLAQRFESKKEYGSALEIYEIIVAQAASTEFGALSKSKIQSLNSAGHQSKRVLLSLAKSLADPTLLVMPPIKLFKICGLGIKACRLVGKVILKPEIITKKVSEIGIERTAELIAKNYGIAKEAANTIVKSGTDIIKDDSLKRIVYADDVISETTQPNPTSSPNFCSTCIADINKDTIVNDADYALQETCFNKHVSGTCANSDINKDGDVDIIDLNCVARNINLHCSR